MDGQVELGREELVGLIGGAAVDALDRACRGLDGGTPADARPVAERLKLALVGFVEQVVERERRSCATSSELDALPGVASVLAEVLKDEDAVTSMCGFLSGLKEDCDE